MNHRKLFLSSFVATAVVTCGVAASARDDALSFIRSEHQALSTLLRQPRSESRDAQVDARLSKLVDYDEFARRAFGQPCPPGRPSCTDHWKTLTPEQRAEATPLLMRVLILAERKNALKTLDYVVDYKGERESNAESTVRMEARLKLKPRDAPLQIDYVVAARKSGWRVVDIVTEGSSRTRNFYDQFHRMLSDSAQGYPYIITKLKENIAKKEAALKERRMAATPR